MKLLIVGKDYYKMEESMEEYLKRAIVYESDDSNDELDSQPKSVWMREIKDCCKIMQFDVEFIGIAKILKWKRSKCACEHCGEGINAEILFQQENGTYGYADYWTGCQTYEGSGSAIFTRKLRKIYRLIAD